MAKKNSKDIEKNLMKTVRSCVTPEGRFIYGIHKPHYNVQNRRKETEVSHLGTMDDGTIIDNRHNFPDSDFEVKAADWIFEIPNPLPFRGSTFIDKEWADSSANDFSRISLPTPEQVSLHKVLEENNIDRIFLTKLPEPVLLALATCSTDAKDLSALAEISCLFARDAAGNPIGLRYTNHNNKEKPIIYNKQLYEAVANNPHLPDNFKKIMVLRPGAQGKSEIIGEWPRDDETHVFEYLRRNSYIAGGHFAANMSDDTIRYSIAKLSESDMNALRHLYYQRTFLRLAEELKIPCPQNRQTLTKKNLETIRKKILRALKQNETNLTSTLWGWNFGFDYAPSKYRLHASHQQIHQQYAMIPDKMASFSGKLQSSCGTMPSFGCGDMVAEVVRHYKEVYESDFFRDYIQSTLLNERMDERTDLESSLIVWQDENVMLFVPKAQTSQWELQLVTLEKQNEPAPGNIVEADIATRNSVDRGILTAQKALAGLGARMVTSIEYPKRIGKTGERGQHLLYSLLPKLPKSPGSFSEAQLRFINGHYPEDFAVACRKQLEN